MLPKSSALKPAVEWASPCPLAATVSAVGTTTSLLIGGPPQMLHCTMRGERVYSPAPQAWPGLVSGLSHAKMHSDLYSHLGSDFNHPPGRNLEVVSGIVSRSAQRDKQVVLPKRHSGLSGGL